MPFDIAKAQIFEFAIANIFNKAFESLFGFVQVLPGAFCAYKWDALKSIENDIENKLDTFYLKSVIDVNYKNSKEINLFKANMLLTEDK